MIYQYFRMESTKSSTKVQTLMSSVQNTYADSNLLKSVTNCMGLAARAVAHSRSSKSSGPVLPVQPSGPHHSSCVQQLPSLSHSMRLASDCSAYGDERLSFERQPTMLQAAQAPAAAQPEGAARRVPRCYGTGKQCPS